MKKITLFIIATLLVACENKPKNNDSSSIIAGNNYPSINNGYEQSNNRVVAQNPSNEAPQNDLVFEERTEFVGGNNPDSYSSSNNTNSEYWKEWESTDFQIYVELENCHSLEEAQDYDLSAIEEDDRYFIEKTIPSGIYEVEVIEKVNSSMWKLRDTNLFLKFRYTPWLYKWDKGIIDTFAGKGTFYKNPDN